MTSTLTIDQLLAIAFIAVMTVTLVVYLRPRRFYFVRHGRTLLNEQRIKQGAEGSLSQAGIDQARRVGAALQGCGARVICASPYVRAQETASLIAEIVKKPIRITPLLAERKNPTSVVGKPVEDPSVKEAMAHTAYGFHEDDYRYADEENFLDLKKRARKCLRYLEGQPSPAICVTHHAFLHMLLSYMLRGEKLHTEDFIKLSFFNPAENGGLTMCEYSPLGGWKILVYNQEVL